MGRLRISLHFLVDLQATASAAELLGLDDSMTR